MNISLKIVAGLIRHALTFGGGIVVADGYMTNNQEMQFVSAAMTVIGIAWSAYQKYSEAQAAKVPAPAK